MLQQTQVDTVVPYFVRFLQALPGFRRLAQAPLEHVLELWSGLGYYRRARNLHLAGQKVVHNFGGEFPSDYQKARSLPGVGDYTARAVLSIAYNQPYAVVDGNVARVVSRLRALRGNLHQRKFRRALTEALELIFSRRRPGNFNQAIMELGQSICLPRAPKCPLCPLRTICQAHRDGAPEAYPERRPRRPSETRYLATVVLYCTPQLLMDSVQSDARKLFDHSPRPLGGEGVSRDPVGTGPRSGTGEGVRFWPQAVQPQATKRLCVALGRGLDEGLMDGLWNFPAAFGSSPGEAVSRLQAKLRDMADSHIRWRDRSGSLRPVAQLHHGITYRSMTVDIYAAEVRGSITMNSLRWFTLSRLPRSAVSSLARKIAEKFCLAGTPSRTCG